MLEEATCPRCGYKWYYRGKRTVYIKCPNCLRDVSFEKAIKKVQKHGNKQ